MAINIYKSKESNTAQHVSVQNKTAKQSPDFFEQIRYLLLKHKKSPAIQVGISNDHPCSDGRTDGLRNVRPVAGTYLKVKTCGGP